MNNKGFRGAADLREINEWRDFSELKLRRCLSSSKKKKGGRGLIEKSNMKQFSIYSDLIRNLCIHFYYTCGRFIILTSVFYYQTVLNFGFFFFLELNMHNCVGALS